MNELRPRVTLRRIVGGVTVFVVASVVLIPLGVEPMPFFLGIFTGLIIVGLVVATVARRQVDQGPR